ncbi:MAG TPA: ATP-binding protein [Methanocorpusculum sp.]|nr:ATP-binding protein [Methanocorpusculum sp.]
MGTPEIKVITGVRRSGKSKLLEQFIAYAQKNQNNNVIHLNLTAIEAAPYRESQALYAYVHDHYISGKNNIVCIDEIQLCNGFEWAVNWLHQKEEYDIYITGSNAFLSSNDLATLFTGRTITIEIFPFSFAEFMRYFELTDSYSALESYIELGGMAGSYLYKNPQDKIRYLKEVYNTLIVRDILDKFNIKNTALLDNLTNYLSDNIGNETSVRKITASLPAQGDKINSVTIGNYLSHLCNAFLFYKISRYDIAGRKYLSTHEKYYISDHSLKTAKIGRKNENYGRILENIVAIELLRRGYEVYVGVLYEKEVDFIAINNSEKIYLQVAAYIDNPETFSRECAPLLSIKDAYPKMILARTREPTYSHEGIKIVDIGNWLLGKE